MAPSVILREIRRLFAFLLAAMAWAMFCALVTGCASEPATITTHGGVRIECPGIVREIDTGFRCGDAVIAKDIVKGVNHFGPRSWWW